MREHPSEPQCVAAKQRKRRSLRKRPHWRHGWWTRFCRLRQSLCIGWSSLVSCIQFCWRKVTYHLTRMDDTSLCRSIEAIAEWQSDLPRLLQPRCLQDGPDSMREERDGQYTSSGGYCQKSSNTWISSLESCITAHPLLLPFWRPTFSSITH